MYFRKDGDKGKLGQVTLFVILGIVIASVIATFFVFRGEVIPNRVPENFEPIYNSYVDCLELVSEDGIRTLAEKGGYIESPEFVAGSSYMPFSSELDFFGQGVPYWMYISGNNILTEQVPTKLDMERSLEGYISERLQYCNFDSLRAQGYEISIENGEAFVNINEESVDVEVINQINLYYGENSFSVGQHSFSVDSKLGKYYDMAKKVYEHEKSSMFLENYAIDVLWNYAPVDGAEYKCSNIVYDETEIRENISDGLSINMNSIRIKGDYYESVNPDMEYFVVDAGIDSDENINFMYMTDWTTKVEIFGDMVADPVGLIPGINMFGFCYVPYHFVYDIDFPVLVQIWDNDFLFQFPVSVVIDNNNPREALPPTLGGISVEESVICEKANSEISVYTSDSLFNPVEANLKFRCLDAVCDMGMSEISENGFAVYEGKVPECVNAIITANAEGYVESNFIISTNKEDLVDMLLYKKHTVDLNLEGLSSGEAIISFVSDDYSTNVVYPDDTEVELADGSYDISVYVFSDSEIIFPAVKDETCVDIPQGLLGTLGITKEECYDINIPEMKIDKAVIGGGYINEQYFTDELLRRSTKLSITVPEFDKPINMDELQENYFAVDESKLRLYFE